MNRHAKASSAASTSGHSGTSSRVARLALLALVAAFLAIPATQASAEIAVNLTGTGAGAVSSNPAGISCSNVGGGAAGPTCGHTFPFVSVQLTASPAADSYLAGWSGNDPNFFHKGTCNSGSANPCTVDRDYAAFGLPPTTVTATFDLLPDPPLAATGSAVPGANFSLWTLQGTVDPEEFKVDQCYFEYGTTSAYGNTTACLDPSASQLDETASAPEAVHAETEPLEPNTTYHYRLLASNLGGTSKGEDRTFTTGAAIDECPDAQSRERRAEQGIVALLLPDCMALEMVSPPHKFGAPASTPNVSADGFRVTFLSTAALGDNPGGLLSVGGATYVASRGESGWTPQMTVPNVKPRFADQWVTRIRTAPQLHPRLLPLAWDRLYRAAVAAGDRPSLRGWPRRLLPATLQAFWGAFLLQCQRIRCSCHRHRIPGSLGGPLPPLLPAGGPGDLLPRRSQSFLRFGSRVRRGLPGTPRRRRRNGVRTAQPRPQ